MSTKAYRDFFIESVEGKQFIDKLYAMIDREHEDAEREPAFSRDHTQRAKGIRQVINEINSVTTDAKKGRLIAEVAEP